MATRTKAGEARQALDAIIKAGPQPTCVFWPFGKNNQGYGMIAVNRKMRLASRAVCEAVHGPAPTEKHQAAHACGNGHLGCVNPGCLYWATSKQNQADRVKHGTLLSGPKNPAAKLTTQDVIAIRSNPTGLKGKDLAALFGVSGQQISKIRLGLQWAVS